MSEETCSITGIEFVKISCGSLETGNVCGYYYNKPVYIRTFLMGRCPVTQVQWESVMGNNPSASIGADRPVECVTWDYCQEFVQKLNQMSGKSYRLPSEAEWVFAASCGGTQHIGASAEPAPEDAAGNYSLVMQHFEQALDCYASEGAAHFENCPAKPLDDHRTRPVGQKEPNGFGVHDMGSSVWEWCQDMWHDDFDGAPEDGSAWVDTLCAVFPGWTQILGGRAKLKSTGPDGAWYEDKRGRRTFHPREKPMRVVRGGTIEYSGSVCMIPRMANYQDWWSPDTGFRLAM